MNFQQTWLYWLAGAVLLLVAVMSWRDKANPRRLTTGLFWGLYGLVFLFGDWTYELVGDKRTVNIGVGVVVVVLALFSIKTALAALKEDHPTARETPYEPMPADAESLITQTKRAH